MDGIHDMGGMHGFGPVVPDGAVFHEDWERRVFGMARVTRAAGLGAGNFRAHIESMPPDSYAAASYYERWLYGTERRLERGGQIAPGEIESRIERFGEEPLPAVADPAQAERAVEVQRKGGPLPAASAARFRPGQRVRVRRMRPATHTRCPRYVRGACGVIERVHGEAVLADASARGDEHPPIEAEYAVRFRSDDLFGPGEEPPFRVLVDLSESYLEEPG